MGTELPALLAWAIEAESRGDFEGLETYARAALALAPQHVAPYYTLARAGRVDAAELLDQLARVPSGGEQELHLRFALGHALDQADRPAEAFAAWKRANRLKGLRFDAARLAADLERALAEMGGGAEGGDLTLEPIFIIGMPRTGSSLVEQILAAHPQVTALGEYDGMARVADAARAGVAGRELVRLYRQGAGIASAARVVTDKNLANLGRLGLIERLFPLARIVHCRRHPVAAGFSAYCLHFEGRSCAWSYDLADQAEVQRLCSAHLERARARSGLRWMELSYEELCADPEGWIPRLVAFCGLSWDERCLKHHLGTRPVRTSSAGQVQQPIYTRSVDRWRAYTSWLGPLLALQSEG